MSDEELREVFKILFERAMPGISLDCLIFAFQDQALKVLCMRYTGQDLWTLPGGWVMRDESLHKAAQRILYERTGLESVYLKQFHTFGEVDRANLKEFLRNVNPNFPQDYLPTRIISIGYYALVDYRKVQFSKDFLTDLTTWQDVADLPELIFDHREIIATGIKTLRAQIDHLPVGYHLMPESFTMPDLQKLHESILGEKVDRANFQKRILSYNILDRLEERRTGGAYKAPFLYRFNLEKYSTFINEEF
jgi:8-oxo-dGTP diphosphatase